VVPQTPWLPEIREGGYESHEAAEQCLCDRLSVVQFGVGGIPPEQTSGSSCLLILCNPHPTTASDAIHGLEEGKTPPDMRFIDQRHKLGKTRV